MTKRCLFFLLPATTGDHRWQDKQELRKSLGEFYGLLRLVLDRRNTLISMALVRIQPDSSSIPESLADFSSPP